METKIIDYITVKLKEYAEIPSVTGNETVFLERLNREFITHEGMSRRTVTNDGKGYYSLLKCGNGPDLVFCVHTDRVPDPKTNEPYKNKIKQNGEFITGQLDNIISIAVMSYLNSIGLKFNILFTTSEEICFSYPQIDEVMQLYGMVPVSVDIDVYSQETDISSGYITIRNKSFSREYDQGTVRLLRKAAEENDIPVNNDSGLSHDEVFHLMRAVPGRNGSHLGLPIYNYHTNREAVSVKAVLNMISLLKAVIEKNEVETEEEPSALLSPVSDNYK